MDLRETQGITAESVTVAWDSALRESDRAESARSRIELLRTILSLLESEPSSQASEAIRPAAIQLARRALEIYPSRSDDMRQLGARIILHVAKKAMPGNDGLKPFMSELMDAVCVEQNPAVATILIEALSSYWAAVPPTSELVEKISDNLGFVLSRPDTCGPLQPSTVLQIAYLAYRHAARKDVPRLTPNYVRALRKVILPEAPSDNNHISAAAALGILDTMAGNAPARQRVVWQAALSVLKRGQPPQARDTWVVAQQTACVILEGRSEFFKPDVRQETALKHDSRIVTQAADALERWALSDQTSPNALSAAADAYGKFFQYRIAHPNQKRVGRMVESLCKARADQNRWKALSGPLQSMLQESGGGSAIRALNAFISQNDARQTSLRAQAALGSILLASKGTSLSLPDAKIAIAIAEKALLGQAGAETTDIAGVNIITVIRMNPRAARHVTSGAVKAMATRWVEQDVSDDPEAYTALMRGGIIALAQASRNNAKAVLEVIGERKEWRLQRSRSAPARQHVDEVSVIDAIAKRWPDLNVAPVRPSGSLAPIHQLTVMIEGMAKKPAPQA